jgi:hypothetical protein
MKVVKGASASWTRPFFHKNDRAPSGKGQIICVIGAMTRRGWVKDSFHVWSGTSKKDDYHDEMNDDRMQTWITKHYLPHAPKKSVLVLDRAPYHTSTTDESKGAKASWNKAELANFIIAKQGRDDNGDLYTLDRLLTQVYTFQRADGANRSQNGMTNDLLFAIAETLAPEPVFNIKTYFQACNASNPGRDLRFLYLPIVTPQLKPIELVWAWIKTDCRRANQNYSTENLKGMLTELSAKAPVEQFQNCFECAKAFLGMQGEETKLIFVEIDDAARERSEAFEVQDLEQG